MLGFAWVDEDEAVVITPAGEQFLHAARPEDVAAGQAMRYQVANPVVGNRAQKSIQVHPVPYLLEVLLKTRTMTKEEYVLFCAKAKSFGDIDDTIEGI